MLLVRTALFCEAEPVQAAGRRGRERESEVFTVNCPPTNPYCPDHSARQMSSLTGLEYTLPNTPTPSVEPPPYNSVLNNTPEDPPPAYDSLYTQKDNQRTDNLPPVWILNGNKDFYYKFSKLNKHQSTILDLTTTLVEVVHPLREVWNVQKRISIFL